jgi:hypothetical protein
MIERAASMVRNVMAQNPWFVAEGVQILPQGSYHNNTNVRQEADMDLRAVHRDIYIEYAPGVIRQYAYAALGYRDSGRTYLQTADQMRTEIARQLVGKFGAAHIDANGNKAIHLKALAGSRADVDVVPSFVLHHVIWNAAAGIYQTINGAAILGKDGKFTLNFPDQQRNYLLEALAQSHASATAKAVTINTCFGQGRRCHTGSRHQAIPRCCRKSHRSLYGPGLA